LFVGTFGTTNAGLTNERLDKGMLTRGQDVFCSICEMFPIHQACKSAFSWQPFLKLLRNLHRVREKKIQKCSRIDVQQLSGRSAAW
jgi:hypothetical protein